VQSRLVRALQRGERAPAKDAVVPDERAVEVGRDDANVVRKAGGKGEAQPFGLPPVALTT